MADTTQTQKGAPPPGEATTPAPDLLNLASSLAAKHAAATTAAPGPGPAKLRGRRSAAEEVASYCQAHGLRLVNAQDSPQTPVDPGPQYVVSPDFVRSMAHVALEGVQAYRQRAAYLKAIALVDDKNLAREIAEGNGAPPGAIDVISYSLAEISQKYDWLSQWTPEVAIIVALGAWIAKDIHTMRRLEALKLEKDAVEKGKAA